MESFAVGTGASIFTQHLVPAILATEHEIILVTCYWARSKMLTALCDALEQLAAWRHAQPPAAVLRLRICFSSQSFFQKLFHTPSRHGYVYPSSTWTTKLGLPSSDTLIAANIELTVKSLFFLPFSVMHPKFLLVDRRHAFLPSCNISWEPWLEGCLELSRKTPRNDSIDGLLEFYKGVWEPDLDLDTPVPPPSPSVSQQGGQQHQSLVLARSPADTYVNLLDTVVPATAVKWLPSWHNRNPGFYIFPWQSPKAPDTPLNSALLRLFENATRDIFLQTPNLTSPPVISAILQALSRGMHIHIITNRKMMVWEQILTAGTTGHRSIRRLTKDYERLCKESRSTPYASAQEDFYPEIDLEAQVPRPGILKVWYFRPSSPAAGGEEPVLSHLKLSIFDGEHTVLGSGNMDRASWFTSQELGILVYGTAFAEAVKGAADRALNDRLDLFFEPKQSLIVHRT